MTLKLGDRVEIHPPMRELDRAFNNFALAVTLRDLRATVVKEPWFLAFHDVYHVGLYVDDRKHAEIEVDWCRPLSAVDLLAERLFPPPEPKPWPKPRDKRSWWRRLVDRIVSIAG